VLRRLISPTKTRARIYDRDANLLLDSRHLYSRGQILRYDLPPVEAEEPDMLSSGVQNFIADLFRRRTTCRSTRNSRAATALPSRKSNALTGGPGERRAHLEQGEQIVSVAVPIQRFRAVLGVLLLSTQGGDIDKIVAGRAQLILRVFGVAALVMVHAVGACSPRPSPIRCAASRRRPTACGAASTAARRFPISPTARTRSATCRSPCAT
jgi:two-component system sensor histidine kinase ChvG